MRSFVSALIAATLATFSSAAPIGAPVNLPASVPSVPLPAGVIPSVGQVSSVGDEVESIADGINVRNIISEISGAVESVESDIHLRVAKLSVAVIFGNIVTEIQPYTEKLTYLVPSNCTVNDITDIVSSIKAPIVAAIPQLEALVGQEASVIFAPVDAAASDVELTVSQIASIVGGDVKLILTAVGQVLDIVEAQGGDIVTDVDSILADLGDTVADLIDVVDNLVDGLTASLPPLLAPVESIISSLGLATLAASLGLTL